MSRDQFHSLRKAANYVSRFQPDEDACLQVADHLRWAADEIEALRRAVRLAHDGWIVTEEPALIEVDTLGQVQGEWTHEAIERAVASGSSGGSDE